MTEKKSNEVKVDLDSIFPSGYVIELGKRQYFQTWREQRIICTELLSRARYFATAEAAEIYSRKKLAFAGMDIQICLVAWILVSWDGMKEIYWQGEFYSMDVQNAVHFLSYQNAQKYQKEKSLQESGIIELHSFRAKKLQLAAA